MADTFQKLDLKQSQNLVMTPQLRQAIEILQMSNLELSTFVEEELSRNPLLERAPDERESDKDKAEPKETDNIAAEFDSAWDGGHASDFDGGSKMADIGAGGSSKFEDPERSLENRLTDSKSLRNHLIEQLHVAFKDPKERTIGELLIDRLDTDGYLRGEPEAIRSEIGCEPNAFGTILTRLRQFDPTGVFARDLPDCLRLQLMEQGRLTHDLDMMLDHLHLLEKADFQGLAKACEVDTEDLPLMLAELRTLNPKPAAEFDHFVVQTVVPDVLMKRRPKNLGGGWRVELNNDTLPKVLINQRYYADISEQAKDKDSKSYISNQMNAANWLVRAMDQRAQTILKVASVIVEHQNAFFLYGIEFLQPLTLREVAEKIEMHESTVSRVTNGKYIGTPRGLFELKFFFTNALAGAGGIAHTPEAIKARIKALIEAEDPKKILSDDALVDLLEKEGIELARRTVAKYREAMHIGSSVQRRRQKAMRS